MFVCFLWHPLWRRHLSWGRWILPHQYRTLTVAVAAYVSFDTFVLFDKWITLNSEFRKICHRLPEKKHLQHRAPKTKSTTPAIHLSSNIIRMILIFLFIDRYTLVVYFTVQYIATHMFDSPTDSPRFCQAMTSNIIQKQKYQINNIKTKSNTTDGKMSLMYLFWVFYMNTNVNGVTTQVFPTSLYFLC